MCSLYLPIKRSGYIATQAEPLLRCNDTRGSGWTKYVRFYIYIYVLVYICPLSIYFRTAVSANRDAGGAPPATTPCGAVARPNKYAYMYFFLVYICLSIYLPIDIYILSI